MIYLTATLAILFLLLSGLYLGWNLRGHYDARRAAEPTLMLFQRPPSKSDDSKL